MSLLANDHSPIEYASLADVVLARLRDAILSGRFGDGERIIEREIATEFGVSRGPIRDALRQLDEEGLVSVLPRRGARVASLTVDDAVEVLEIRAALEPVAVRMLVERANAQPERLAGLERVVEQLAEASKRGTGRRW